MVSMAFHRNWIGMFDAISARLAGASCWREGNLFFARTGLSYATFNVAILEDSAPLSVADLNRIEAAFAGTGLPYSVQFCAPERLPHNAAFLRDVGYLEAFSDPLRWNAQALRLPVIHPAIRITPVASPHERQIYIDTVILGFDLLSSNHEFIDVMLDLESAYHVLAWLEDQPVGVGSLLWYSGVAGVYNVSTIPTARRQGVAAAIMQNLHQHAQMLGYPGTALASSSMGLEFYRRLGYQPDGYQIAFEPGLS